jgi:hypothetical protein
MNNSVRVRGAHRRNYSAGIQQIHLLKVLRLDSLRRTSVQPIHYPTGGRKTGYEVRPNEAAAAGN